MRRDEIIRGIAIVDGVLGDEGGFLETLDRLDDRDLDVRDRSPTEMFIRRDVAERVLRLRSALAGLPSPAREIADLLPLRAVRDFDVIASLLDSAQAASTPARTLSNDLRDARATLASLRGLLLRESDLELQLPEEQRQVFRIVMPDEGVGVRVTVVMDLLHSLAGLYAVAAQVTGDPPDDLILVACDSGSPQLFDFKGSAGAVREVRKTLAEIVGFFRDWSADRRARDLANAGVELSLIREIGVLEEEGQLEPAQANSMRRRLLDDSRVFASTGAVPAELETEMNDGPRRLTVAPKRLLTAGVSDSEADSPNADAPRAES